MLICYACNINSINLQIKQRYFNIIKCQKDIMQKLYYSNNNTLYYLIENINRLNELQYYYITLS